MTNWIRKKINAIGKKRGRWMELPTKRMKYTFSVITPETGLKNITIDADSKEAAEELIRAQYANGTIHFLWEDYYKFPEN